MSKIPIRRMSAAEREHTLSNKFSIRRVEDLTGSKDLVQKLHRYDFFFIMSLQKGEGIHEIDFTTYNIFGNSVFFMRPGQVHQFDLKANSTGYIIEFRTEFYHPKDRLSAKRLRKASK